MHHGHVDKLVVTGRAFAQHSKHSFLYLSKDLTHIRSPSLLVNPHAVKETIRDTEQFHKCLAEFKNAPKRLHLPGWWWRWWRFKKIYVCVWGGVQGWITGGFWILERIHPRTSAL